MLEEKNDDRTSRGMPSHKLLLPIIFNTNGGRSQNLRGRQQKKGICNPHFDNRERNEAIFIFKRRKILVIVMESKLPLERI